MGAYRVETVKPHFNFLFIKFRIAMRAVNLLHNNFSLNFNHFRQLRNIWFMIPQRFPVFRQFYREKPFPARRFSFF